LRIAGVDLNAFGKQPLHLLDIPPLCGPQQHLPSDSSRLTQVLAHLDDQRRGDEARDHHSSRNHNNPSEFGTPE
jgi:hypothetical protein